MKRPIKAVIPAAGFGTRFLPQTKSFPKEMLPIVNKPVIQLIVEELVDAGIQDVIFVTGYHKRAIEDHFDLPNRELVENLLAGGEKKKPMLEEIEKIGNMANFIYLRQKGKYGNGTPILNSQHIVNGEPFVFKWADDLMTAEPSAIKQLIDAYEKYQAPVLACLRARSDADFKQWAFAGGTEIEDGVIDLTTIVEKPGKENAPSDLGAMFGMILTPDIFPYLQKAYDDGEEGVEVNYADGIRRMVEDGKKAYAIEIKGGTYYDTGNKLDYLKTIVEFAKRDKKIGEEFKEWLKSAT
jgi:UTP--glucose-1-phosphate uridylyltransferase